MSLKRNRPESSSNQLVAPVKKLDSSGEASSANISKFGSPANDYIKLGGFLERCHYCTKSIDQTSEVFMYSNLCAFCSSECRDYQIALDQYAEKQQQKALKKSAQGQGNGNGQANV